MVGPALGAPGRYNQEVRIAMLLASALALIGCRGANQDQEAIRQGILDHLAEAGLSNQNMDVSVTSFKLNGEKADAVVQIAAKGAGPGLQMHYTLQHQGNRWVVTAKADPGPGHGTGVVPGVANPHDGSGGGFPEPVTGSGQKMPLPEDLPPTGKKKQ